MNSLTYFTRIIVFFQDVMILGAVGAYAWSGTVVHQKGSQSDILPFSAFEGTLQDKNDSSLLGLPLHSCYVILNISM